MLFHASCCMLTWETRFRVSLLFRCCYFFPRGAAVVVGLADASVLSTGVQEYVNSSNIAVLWTSLLFGLR